MAQVNECTNKGTVWPWPLKIDPDERTRREARTRELLSLKRQAIMTYAPPPSVFGKVAAILIPAGIVAAIVAAGFLYGMTR